MSLRVVVSHNSFDGLLRNALSFVHADLSQADAPGASFGRGARVGTARGAASTLACSYLEGDAAKAVVQERASIRGVALRPQVYRLGVDLEVVRWFWAFLPLLQFGLFNQRHARPGKGPPEPAHDEPPDRVRRTQTLRRGRRCCDIAPGHVRSQLLAQPVVCPCRGNLYGEGFWLLLRAETCCDPRRFLSRQASRSARRRGAIAIGAPISEWLYVVTTLGALFLALNKRKHEVLLLGAEGKSTEECWTNILPPL